MTSQRDSLVELAGSVQTRLMELLDGMDYCLDWRAESESWSVRQVIYHLLDTPPGGIQGIVKGLVDGTLTEYDLWADRDNITPQRMEHDLEQLRSDINGLFADLNQTLAGASDQDLLEKAVTVHIKSRNEDATRNGKELLERQFTGHWEDHLNQLQEVREALGF